MDGDLGRENLGDSIPIKLKKTYLQKGQPKRGALPHAYYKPPFTYTTDEWNASQGWAAGAVVSNSEDFARFLRALFTGKLFRKKDSVQKELSRFTSAFYETAKYLIMNNQ